MRSEKTDALRNAIAEAVAAAFPQLADVVVELELPRDARFGDVSCNVAMKEARRLRTSPRKIA